MNDILVIAIDAGKRLIALEIEGLLDLSGPLIVQARCRQCGQALSRQVYGALNELSIEKIQSDASRAARQDSAHHCKGS